MTKETILNLRYTDEYKHEALRLAETVGINQAAQRLGMPASSLGNWMRQKRSGKLPAASPATPMTGSPAELEAGEQSVAP
jgi:transposase